MLSFEHGTAATHVQNQAYHSIGTIGHCVGEFALRPQFATK